MTIEDIKQELINQNKNPDDFNIEIAENGYSVTPKWFYENKQVAKIEDDKLKIEIDLATAMNTAETLEVITFLSEMQKIEQAQSNAELIELMLSLQGGV